MARSHLRCWLALLCVLVESSWQAFGENDVEQLASENAMLKLRLRALEDQVREEAQFSYVVVKGYISGAENIYMETMEVDDAKAYCNSNPRCKGFTFNGPVEHPEDEVTVAFKSGSKVAHDINWVSYVKESSMFGALHGAMKLDEAGSPAVITQGLTFESICIVFALGLSAAFICRGRCGAAFAGQSDWEARNERASSPNADAGWGPRMERGQVT